MKSLVWIILLSFVICSCKKEPVDNMVVTEKDDVTTIDNTKADSIHLANLLDSLNNLRLDSIHLANLLDSLNNLRLDSICKSYNENKPKYIDQIVGKYVGTKRLILRRSSSPSSPFTYDTIITTQFEFEIKKHPLYESNSCDLISDDKENLYNLSYNDEDSVYTKLYYRDDQTYYHDYNSCNSSYICPIGNVLKTELQFNPLTNFIEFKSHYWEYNKPYSGINTKWITIDDVTNRD